MEAEKGSGVRSERNPQKCQMNKLQVRSDIRQIRSEVSAGILNISHCVSLNNKYPGGTTMRPHAA